MRTLSLFALILVSVTFSQAQRLIPKAGVVLTTTSATNFVSELENSVSYKTGYTVGLGYTIPVTSLGKGLLMVQPEVNYITKGFSIDAKGELLVGGEVPIEIITSQSYTLNYLEFPVLAKYEIGSDFLRFNFHTGAAIGFALGGKFKSDVTVNYFDGETPSYSYSGKGDIIFYNDDNSNENLELDHNVDISWQAGAGVTIQNRIAFDIRYGLSLTNLQHEQDSKNRVFQFTVGVPLGK